MTISSAKKFAVLLLFFLLTAPSSTTSEIHSSDSLDPSSSSLNKFSVYYSFDIQLSSVYLAFSLVYLSFLVNWISICLKIKQSHRRIHYLMGGLLLTKSVTWIYKYYEELTGTHRSDFSFYIYLFFSIVRLSSVLQLITNCWSFVEPFMQQIDKIVLMIVIPLQVLAHIAHAVIIGETGDINEWENLKEMLIHVDLITCVMMLVIGFTMIPLIVANRDFDKLTHSKFFISMIMIYLTFVGLVRNFNVGAELVMKANVAKEISTLMFYTQIPRFFRLSFLVVDHED